MVALTLSCYILHIDVCTGLIEKQKLTVIIYKTGYDH